MCTGSPADGVDGAVAPRDPLLDLDQHPLHLPGRAASAALYRSSPLPAEPAYCVYLVDLVVVASALLIEINFYQMKIEEGRDLAGVLVFAEVGHGPDTDWCGPVRPPRPVRGGTRHQPPARGGALARGLGKVKCASVQVGLEEALEPSSGSKATELRGRRVSATTAGRATIILDSRRGTRHT